MKSSLPLRTLSLVGALCAASSAFAAGSIITQWNFNSTISDSNPSTGTLSPSIGSGTASLFGGTTSTFASGDASGGSSDPATGDDSGWNVTTFAGVGTGNMTRGVEFLVSTIGYSSASYSELTFSFDQRFSNTAANTAVVQYTVNGTDWIIADTLTFTPAASGTGDTWFNERSVTISDTAAFDNASFGLRILAAFDPVAGDYLAARSTSSYGTTSTWRFDMVTLGASPIPEPSAFAALAGGVALAGVALRRRRRA